MRRKQINYGDFNRIEQDSLSNAAYELTEAENILANILETGPLSLYCFDSDQALFETTEGTYVRADYELANGKINFDNVEEIIIDEGSHQEASKEVVRGMIDALVEEDTTQADMLFQRYMEMAAPKMKYMKGSKNKSEMAKAAANVKGNMMSEVAIADIGKKSIVSGGSPTWKKSLAAKKGSRGGMAQKKGAMTKKKTKEERDRKKKPYEGILKQAREEAKKKKKGGDKAARVSTIHWEWAQLAGNVLDYLDYMSMGPSIAEANTEYDNLGDVVNVAIPASRMRTEAKLLSLKWDTLKTDVKVFREQALQLAHSEEFCDLVGQIKRLNNMSSNTELTETIGDLVGQFPAVLYLTQDELAKILGEALNNAGHSNYDDETCGFIAEGILRVACESYPERVNHIAGLANVELAEGDAKYDAFQDTVRAFYPSIDETFALETQVFADLYSALTEVSRMAAAYNQQEVRGEAIDLLEELAEMAEDGNRPDLALANEAANFLLMLVETNLRDQPWTITKTPYRTTVGEHPDMAKKARHSYSPAADGEGDWNDPLPALDDEGGSYKGKGADQMRNHSWSQKGGNEVWPALDNPYVPKPFGDYTIKGEVGVDKAGDATGQWGDSNTWPNLSNPYVPKDVKVHVNDPNRVDDVQSRVGMKQVSDLDQKISG